MRGFMVSVTSAVPRARVGNLHGGLHTPQFAECLSRGRAAPELRCRGEGAWRIALGSESVGPPARSAAWNDAADADLAQRGAHRCGAAAARACRPRGGASPRVSEDGVRKAR